MNQQNPTIAGLHILRYGTAADQKYLLNEFLDTYDQLVINANMVAHMPGALASLIAQRAKNKPYFIDPQTHAFQHDTSFLESSSKNSEGELKRSIKKLLNAYGDPVKSCVETKGEAILPEDFEDDGARAAFCARVIEFQRSSIAKEVKHSDSAKYYTFVSKRTPSLAEYQFQPTCVVAPYFYMAMNTFEDWLPVNVNCAKDSASFASRKRIPLAIQIVFSREILNSPHLLEKLTNQYKDIVQPDVFLVWVDQFSEHQASALELIALVQTINHLGKSAPVVILYGGFLSVALKKCGIVPSIAGVAHGLEYGEDRGVVPVSGGIPVAKYYLPALHGRYAFKDAVRVIRAIGGFQNAKTFHKRICDCDECRSVVRSEPEADFEAYGGTRPLSFVRRNQPVVMQYPLPETRAHSVRHYMWSKAREYKNDLNLNDLLKQLRDGEKMLARNLGLEQAKYCRVWSSVLEAEKNSQK